MAHEHALLLEALVDEPLVLRGGTIWYALVSPSDAVASCGAHARYVEPSKEVAPHRRAVPLVVVHRVRVARAPRRGVGGGACVILSIFEWKPAYL